MKRFKNLNATVSGVSIIEAVIALLVISIAVSMLLVSQGTSLRMGVATIREQEIIQALERRFVEIDKDHLDASKKSIISDLEPPLPVGKIEYRARKPSETSELSRYKNVHIETVTARWSDGGRDQVTELHRLRNYAEENKDERT